jgi:hypothetical protein
VTVRNREHDVWSHWSRVKIQVHQLIERQALGGHGFLLPVHNDGVNLRLAAMEMLVLGEAYNLRAVLDRVTVSKSIAIIFLDYRNISIRVTTITPTDIDGE